jgi:hypothetical protein
MDKKVQSRSVPVYRSPDIIRRIKATSLLWERHLKKMDNKEMPKRVRISKSKDAAELGENFGG